MAGVAARAGAGASRAGAAARSRPATPAKKPATTSPLVDLNDFDVQPDGSRPDIKKPPTPDPAPPQPTVETSSTKKSGRKAATKKKASPLDGLPSPTLKPRGRGDLGGVLLGLVVYSIALAYVQHGPAGPKSWFTAKFFNRPTVGDGVSPSSSTTGSGTVQL